MSVNVPTRLTLLPAFGKESTVPSRLIVIGSATTTIATEVFEDLQVNIEDGALGQNVSILDAAGEIKPAQIVKDPRGALQEAIVSLRSDQAATVVVKGVSTVPAPAFDLLGWNLDVAASADLAVIYALEGTGMSAELIGSDIRTFLQRAKVHHATVAGVVVSGARGQEITDQPVPVFHSPLGRDEVAVLTEARPYAVTPLAFEGDLLARASANKQRIVLPEPEDARILTAVDQLLAQGVAEIILIGDEAAIKAQADSLNLDVSGAQFTSTSDVSLRDKYATELARLRAAKGMTLEGAQKVLADETYFATMMVQMGDADGMVSGATHTTADTIRPAFQIIKTAPGVNLVSSSFIMLFSDRPMVFGDCAVVVSPDANQLAQIAVSSARTALAFGIDPKVALLSYSSRGSGSGPSVDLVTEATQIAQQLAPDLSIDGPLQFDAAIDADTGAQKAPESSVAGRANVLIFPDLNAGNIAYKTAQRTAGAIAVGPILQGLRKPVNDLSRGATVDDIVNTVAITAVQAQQQQGTHATQGGSK